MELPESSKTSKGTEKRDKNHTKCWLSQGEHRIAVPCFCVQGINLLPNNVGYTVLSS